MATDRNGNAHKPCERAMHSAVCEMRDIVREAALPLVPGDSVKAQIGRAARRTRLNFRRAQAFWYGQSCAVRAEEADRLRQLRREIAAQRIAALEAELAAARVLIGQIGDME